VLAISTTIGAVAVATEASNVSTTPTEEDRYYARLILERAGYDASPDSFGDLSQFDNQISAILAAQDAVMKATAGFPAEIDGGPLVAINMRPLNLTDIGLPAINPVQGDAGAEQCAFSA
jgi:hypothetical protein